MKENNLWERFIKTGRIEDYIQYSLSKNKKKDLNSKILFTNVLR